MAESGRTATEERPAPPSRTKKATRPVWQVALRPQPFREGRYQALAFSRFSGFSCELPLRDSAGIAPDFPCETPHSHGGSVSVPVNAAPVKHAPQPPANHSRRYANRIAGASSAIVIAHAVAARTASAFTPGANSRTTNPSAVTSITAKLVTTVVTQLNPVSG